MPSLILPLANQISDLLYGPWVNREVCALSLTLVKQFKAGTNKCTLGQIGFDQLVKTIITSSLPDSLDKLEFARRPNMIR